MPAASYGRDARDDGSLRGPCTPRDSTPPTLCTEEGHGAHRGDTASPTATCSAERSCAAGWTWALCLRRRPVEAAPAVKARSSICVRRRMFHVKRRRCHDLSRLTEYRRLLGRQAWDAGSIRTRALPRQSAAHFRMGGVSARSAAAVFPLLSCAPQDTTTAPSAPKRTRPPRRRAARTTQFPSGAPSSTRTHHPM